VVGGIRWRQRPPDLAGLAAVRPLLVRDRGERGGHRRGLRPGRTGTRDLPGGSGSAGPAVVRAADPGPDQAGLDDRLRRRPGRAARPGRAGRRRPGPGRARVPAGHRGRSGGRDRLVPRCGRRLRQRTRAARPAGRLIPVRRARLRRHARGLPGRRGGRPLRRGHGRGRRGRRPDRGPGGRAAVRPGLPHRDRNHRPPVRRHGVYLGARRGPVLPPRLVGRTPVRRPARPPGRPGRLGRSRNGRPGR
jgi:hypothetical protein